MRKRLAAIEINITVILIGGGCVAKPKCLKTSNYPNVFKFLKLRKKVKSKMIYNGEKTENCDTRTYDVIRRNFEKSNNHEINL